MSDSTNVDLSHFKTRSERFVHIAKAFGTPVYIYEEDIIDRQLKLLNEALKGISFKICYAVKANSNLSILSLFQLRGAGFDIVSQGELKRAIRIGADPKTIVFAGVGKTESEIREALAHDILMINVESVAELNRIEEIAESLGCTASISFRVNPDVEVETHPYLATGLKTSKFGIPISEVKSLWKKIKESKFLKLVGIDCHIGSHINDINPLRDAYTQMVTLANELKAEGADITHIDFGGGLGVSYSGRYEPLNLNLYGQMIKEVCKGSNFIVLIEPGKFLIAEAGTLVSEVQYIKKNYDKNFAVIDAGMNDLIRPPLYDGYHKIELLGSKEGRKELKLDIVGPVCESACFFAQDRDLLELRQGDLVAIYDAGAYGFSMASNYNSRLRPAEVLITQSGSAKLIRQRENFEDLWRNEEISN